MDFWAGAGFWLLSIWSGTLWVGSLRDDKSRWLSCLYLVGYVVGLGGFGMGVDVVHYADLAEFLETSIYFSQWELVKVQVFALGWVETFKVNTPVWVGNTFTSDQVFQSVNKALRHACQRGLTLKDLSLTIVFDYLDGQGSYQIESESLAEQLDYWRSVQEFQARQMRLF